MHAGGETLMTCTPDKKAGMIVSLLRKSGLLHRLRVVENGLFSLMPDRYWANVAISQYHHYLENRRFANLRNPRRFNDHLIRLKLSPVSRMPLFAQTADKWRIKAFVRQHLGEGYSAPTLALLATPEEIDAFRPTQRCVIKPTHLSGEVIFNDGSPLSAAERARMRRWLRRNHFVRTREPVYKDLEGRIIVEAFLGDGAAPPADIKVWCFGGHPRIVQVDSGRYGAHFRDLYDADGTLLPIRYRHPTRGLPFPFPDALAEIRHVAGILSADLIFVRVDLYVVAGKVVVGELTNFPTNGNIPIQPPAADRAIARLFEQPDRPLCPRELAGN